MEQLNNFSFKLQALLNCTGNKLMTRDKQQQLSDVIRSNPGWSCAHIAAKLLLVECFSDELVAQLVELTEFSFLLSFILPCTLLWYISLVFDVLISNLLCRLNSKL